MNITKHHTIRQIKAMSEFKSAKHYFTYTTSAMGRLLSNAADKKTLQELASNPSGIIRGLGRLAQVLKLHGPYYLYDRKAVMFDRMKKDVNIIFFPPLGEHRKKTAVILTPGGAYMSVCSLAEGYGSAAQLNEMGYPVFVLTYRVAKLGIMPKPLEDLACAIHYIRAHAEEFSIDPDDYIVGGFSAGGNLTCLWGLEKHGYQKYGLPKPRALLPIYPAINHTMYYKGKESDFFNMMMFGPKYTEELAAAYDVDTNMGKDFPPCYIVACTDDKTVPIANSRKLKECLDNWAIPAVLEEGSRGGHGFGDGTGTDVEGWIPRALAFVEKQR